MRNLITGEKVDARPKRSSGKKRIDESGSKTDYLGREERGAKLKGENWGEG